MRRRVMIIIFCVVAFLAVAVLLCTFLFAVREIRVEFYAADAAQITRYEDEIKTEADYIRNKNILFLDENKLAGRIQQKLEDIEVVGVVRDFPNVVTVQINVRYPHAYVELTENGAVSGYAIVDNTLRVRSVVKTQPADLILLTGEAMRLTRVKVGEKLISEPSAYADILSETFANAARYGYANFDCVALMDSIAVTSSSSGYDVTIETATGATIEIAGVDLYREKIRFALSTYCADEKNKGANVVIRAYTTGSKRDKVTCVADPRRD